MVWCCGQSSVSSGCGCWVNQFLQLVRYKVNRFKINSIHMFGSMETLLISSMFQATERLVRMDTLVMWQSTRPVCVETWPPMEVVLVETIAPLPILSWSSTSTGRAWRGSWRWPGQGSFSQRHQVLFHHWRCLQCHLLLLEVKRILLYLVIIEFLGQSHAKSSTGQVLETLKS